MGAFNWWMRLLTGLLAGFATVWLVYPQLEEAFSEVREALEIRLQRQTPTGGPPESTSPPG